MPKCGALGLLEQGSFEPLVPRLGREAPPLPFAIVEYVAIVQATAGVPNCKGAKP